MLLGAELVAFVSTTEIGRARRFYEDLLELRLVEETPYALVFDCGGTTLRVTAVGELDPVPQTVLGWRVSDAREAVLKLAARGVAVERFDEFEQDQDGIWEAPGGSLVAWFKDPDGNLLSLTQT
jgi:catechol 2,3-dioxygenase-like lactoylglutathione lyase family enzyme